MAGLGIRLFTDENIRKALAQVLRSRGYDVESCHDATRDNLRISDEQQLVYATQQGRAVLTFDVEDFLQLERRWKAADLQHAGIIVAREIRDFGTLIRRVQFHLDNVDPETQLNTLLWLM